ncbi:TIGR01244 family sulfur transferase [Andreprevotia chitinilytica]|uniref:TIGR01244 family sulfur transferase n=1 Tax=Andreprevotia chitinilytica TaxID=396808 RepID=UPI00068C5A80|nr:TIGR01244 family sulfur transferase [Andreprevotia chitinilytica]
MKVIISSNKWIFGLSVLLGVFIVLGMQVYSRWTQPPQIKINNLTTDISVTEQLKLDVVPQLKAQGFATIIDLRPDGEAADQPAAATVESAARANNVTFAYVPVPHGDIPDAAVAALDKALSTSPRPILLYCRSGRRAARTWSLVEASRPGGLDAAAILAAVKASGQSADDLDTAITQRIAQRAQTLETQ